MRQEWLFECGRCGALLWLARPTDPLPPHQRPFPDVPCFQAGQRGIFRARLGAPDDVSALPTTLAPLTTFQVGPPLDGLSRPC